ncbi:DUF5658 family protein [Candidatus Poribacteria bacterium]
MRWLLPENEINTSKSKNWHRWLEIIVAGLIYILANAFDYYLTVYGIMNTTYREANPIVRGYMDIFGLTEGLMIYKVLMVGLIILAVITVDLFYRKKNIRFRPEYILYVGALMTTLGGSLWLVKL